MSVTKTFVICYPKKQLKEKKMIHGIQNVSFAGKGQLVKKGIEVSQSAINSFAAAKGLMPNPQISKAIDSQTMNDVYKAFEFKNIFITPQIKRAIPEPIDKAFVERCNSYAISRGIPQDKIGSKMNIEG